MTRQDLICSVIKTSELVLEILEILEGVQGELSPTDTCLSPFVHSPASRRCQARWAETAQQGSLRDRDQGWRWYARAGPHTDCPLDKEIDCESRTIITDLDTTFVVDSIRPLMAV